MTENGSVTRHRVKAISPSIVVCGKKKPEKLALSQNTHTVALLAGENMIHSLQ